MKTLYSDKIPDLESARAVAQNKANGEHQNVAIYRNATGLYMVLHAWDVLPGSYRIEVIKPKN